MSELGSLVGGFSVAITTYQNHEFLQQCLPPLFESDEVSEIVISDDSSNLLTWLRAREQVTEVAKNAGFEPETLDIIDASEGTHDHDSIAIGLTSTGRVAKKLILSRNESNLGGFRNKFVSVLSCSKEWVLVLDADNIIGVPALKALGSMPAPRSPQAYCALRLTLFSQDSLDLAPSTLKTKHQLAAPRMLANTELDGHFFSHLLSSPSPYSRAQASFFLNTGNFLVHRTTYVETLRPRFQDSSFDPKAACSVAFAAPWLISGGSFVLVKGFEYAHRLHSSSYWALNTSRGEASGLELEIRQSFPLTRLRDWSLRHRAFEAVLAIISLPRDSLSLISRLTKSARRTMRTFLRTQSNYCDQSTGANG